MSGQSPLDGVPATSHQLVSSCFTDAVFELAPVGWFAAIVSLVVSCKFMWHDFVLVPLTRFPSTPSSRSVSISWVPALGHSAYWIVAGRCLLLWILQSHSSCVPTCSSLLVSRRLGHAYCLSDPFSWMGPPGVSDHIASKLILRGIRSGAPCWATLSTASARPATVRLIPIAMLIRSMFSGIR